jgi:hypothetical protein
LRRAKRPVSYQRRYRPRSGSSQKFWLGREERSETPSGFRTSCCEDIIERCALRAVSKGTSGVEARGTISQVRREAGGAPAQRPRGVAKRSPRDLPKDASYAAGGLPHPVTWAKR